MVDAHRRGLLDVLGLHAVAAGEVRDRAGDAEHPAVAAGAQPLAVVEGAERAEGLGSGGGEVAQQAGGQLGVAGQPYGRQAKGLALTGGDDALADLAR